MSNRTVPQFFSSVVNEVTKNIESDFREYGVSQDVLSNLKTIWMEKIIQSHVADFQAETVTVAQPQQAHPAYAGHPMAPGHMMLPTYVPQAGAYGNPVKNEPVDPRFALGAAAAAYSIPTLPGPQLGGRTAQTATTASPVMPYQGRYTPSNGTATATGTSSSSTTPRIPQVDGPSNYDESEDEDDDSGPSQPQYAPRTLHPSLPQPQQPQQKTGVDDEAINSDLDDSDDEGGNDENGSAESDIMFCTYDKVARVKNKWKCVLKDGIVHVNGKDYLFQKCTGEFEW